MSVPQSLHRSRRRWTSPIWLVPLGALALAGYVVHRKLAEEGKRIEIEFRDASGLEANKTELQFRGVKIGGVTGLHVSPDLKKVLVEVTMNADESDLARKGSQFWIVRPKLSAGSITGLSTIVSGVYVELKPGRGAPADTFVGLEKPPVEKEEKDDLEIFLIGDRLGSMDEGTPILYRGVQVGAVNDTRLSEDARQVRVRAYIYEEFKDLVRANSQFWNAGGIQANFGLFSGLRVKAKSVNALVAGAVAFATPNDPGARVEDGHAFTLNEKQDPKWLSWSPSIPIHPRPERPSVPKSSPASPQQGNGSRR